MNRPLLVGTAESIRWLTAAIDAAGDGIEPIGSIVVSGSVDDAAPGPRPLGGIDDIAAAVAAHDCRAAFICIPAAMGELNDRVTAELESLGVAIRRFATFRDQLDGRTSASAAGVIDPTRLLGRPPRPLDHRSIERTLRGKRVMITGAGGSIGSELAWIVAGFGAAELQLMERAENNLFEVDRDLAARAPDVPRTTILHDVTDAERTADIVRRLRPQVIFHAAAHKHVPMMEDHPRQALLNNLFGTKAIADAAEEAGVERFVMISTDKAVHPSSVMGATKRIAELYVQNLARRTPMACSIVRFGNVLASACSVVPIWTRQLAEGGPITVTDRQMTRYFMTIPEAAALVIQAASLRPVGGDDDADGRANGSIFILDMGEPIRIIDLAERFVRLHGLEPQRDVAIAITGIRPGEKLHERLAYDDEDVERTAHPAVHLLRARSSRAPRMDGLITAFERLRNCDEREPILGALRDALPEMVVRDGGAEIAA